MAEVGPDGNVWVIDWYNYIVQHNPTPAGFETGKGNAYRDRPARQEARPNLSSGLSGHRVQRGNSAVSPVTLGKMLPPNSSSPHCHQPTCFGVGMRSVYLSSVKDRGVVPKLR